MCCRGNGSTGEGWPGASAARQTLPPRKWDPKSFSIKCGEKNPGRQDRTECPRLFVRREFLDGRISSVFWLRFVADSCLQLQDYLLYIKSVEERHAEQTSQ